MSRNTYRKLLRLALANKLPPQVDPTSRICFRSIGTLIERGYLSALGSRPSSAGLTYLEPKITVKGKELLRRLDEQSPLFRVKNALRRGWYWGVSLGSFCVPIAWSYMHTR